MAELRLIAKACTTLSECPAVLELPDGRLAIIGALLDDTDPERTTVQLPADVMAAAQHELREHRRP